MAATVDDQERPDTEVPPEAEPGEASAPRNPLRFLGLSGTAESWVSWISVAVAVWILITAVSVIGDGFSAATGGQAEELFQFATNPFVALTIGILATVGTQSSSTTTSIVVGLAAGGLPMEIAIPMLMGANLGTTVTNTLVSMGMAGNKEQFRRAFSAASVHDFYNIMAVAILLPVELLTGFLDTTSEAVSGAVSGDGGIVAAAFTAFGDAVKAVTSPGADFFEWAVSPLPEVWGGIVLIAVGVALILLVIGFIGNMMKSLMVGRAKKILHGAIGRGPLSGIGSGTVITMIVQSSSTTTSLVVPLVGSGAFTIRQIYPFTVGANIGTTLTALIASFAFTGIEGQLALQAALVHLFFNVTAAIVIFGLPFLRPLPVKGATWLGDLCAQRRIWAVVWVVSVFVVLPLVFIALTTALG